MTIDVGADDNPLRFGQLVRQHRMRIGLTQRELADFSTISVRAIRDLEQGKARRPRQDTVRLIANGLRLSGRARADLELAADHGRSGWALRTDYEAELAAPPAVLDSLVGRESETAVLERELTTGDERLIDIIGLNGVGKTRLALEVATRLHSAGLPVLWAAAPGAPAVYRVPIRDDRLWALVRACVDDVFGPDEVTDDRWSGSGRLAVRPAAPSADFTAFSELVADRETLLVLDGAGPRRPRQDQVLRLLQDCPRLRILVTSVRPFDLPGERLFLLPPLELPRDRSGGNAESPVQTSAVRLFLSHVRRIRPEYELTGADLPVIAEICHRLDGLPRALAAAASWLTVYDPEMLCHALRNDPASLLDHLDGAQHSAGLRDGLWHCVRELPAADRDLLARLCELGTEFTLEDVVTLTGQTHPESGRMLRSLLMHGVVRPRYDDGQCRFQVLNLVRAVRGAATELVDVRA